MGKTDRYARDKTFLNRKKATELAENYGTPLFVYDSKTLFQQVKSLSHAFAWNRGFRSFFPVRLLNNPHLLRVIHQAGCGVQCCNEVELRLARLAEIPGEDIQFYSCFPGFSDWRFAISSGATIILDRADQLADIRTEEYGDRAIGLRLNTDGFIAPPGLPRNAYPSKLGMDKKELFAVAKKAASRGFQKIGLYLSASGEVYSEGLLSRVTRVIMRIAGELGRELGIQVAWCHIGGDIYWSTEENQVDYLPREAALIRKSYGQALKQWPELKDIPLFAEIGQYISMPAGLVLTRAAGVKTAGCTYVGTELSCAHMPQATRFRRHYHVSKPGKDMAQGRETFCLAGNLPDPGDVLKGASLLHPVETGELLLIHDAGGFGRASSSNFCGSLRCAEVLMDDHGHRLISRRETFEDYIACLEGYQKEQKHSQEHCAQPQGEDDFRDLGSKA